MERDIEGFVSGLHDLCDDLRDIPNMKSALAACSKLHKLSKRCGFQVVDNVRGGFDVCALARGREPEKPLTLDYDRLAALVSSLR